MENQRISGMVQKCPHALPLPWLVDVDADEEQRKEVRLKRKTRNAVRLNEAGKCAEAAEERAFELDDK
jgi:hypothetical protein